MATEPDWHPVDEEIRQILADNPGLLEQLQEADGAYDRGELEMVSEEEVRQRLAARGVKLSSRPGQDPDPPTR